MVIARIFGWILLAAAVAVAAMTLTLWLRGNDLSEIAGQLWYQHHPGSLALTQTVTERYLHPALWDRVLVPLLQRPASVVLSLAAGGPLVLGSLLLAIFRKREKKRFFTRPPV